MWFSIYSKYKNYNKLSIELKPYVKLNLILHIIEFRVFDLIVMSMKSD
jgi:hypothetical protein